MNADGWKGADALNPSPAQQFWETVGRRVEFDELEVGEVFLLDTGKTRQVCRVTRRDGNSFEAVPLPPGKDDLPEDYKVWVMNS